MSTVEMIHRVSTKTYVHIPNDALYDDPGREGISQIYVSGAKYSGEDFLIGGKDHMGRTVRWYIRPAYHNRWCRVFKPAECRSINDYLTNALVMASNAIVQDDVYYPKDGWRKVHHVEDEDPFGDGEHVRLSLQDAYGDLHSYVFQRGEVVDYAGMPWFDTLVLLRDAEEALRAELGYGRETPMTVVSDKAISIIQRGGPDAPRVAMLYNTYVSARTASEQVPELRAEMPV